MQLMVAGSEPGLPIPSQKARSENGEQVGLGSNHGSTTYWLRDFGKLLHPSETQLLHLQHVPYRVVVN